MNFFSRVKAAGSLIVGKSGGGWERMFEGIGAGNNNADLARPYANSVWVSAAIKFVAGPISAVPIIFTEDRRGGDVEIENPELTKFWQKPAKTKGGLMTQSAFLTATVGWLKLRGESFWILDDTWLMPRAKKSPLIVARPNEMREILSADRELIGWQYLDGRGKQSTLIPEQVRNIKFWNPYNEFRGLGEWEAAKMAADADYAQGVFARNLAKNNGDRGPIVIGKSGVASKEQQDQITALLRQKRELARQGDYRPIFLTGDIDVKEPGLQAVDAAYVAQRLENRHEIFVAFGVPPSFADVSASYSIGSASDRFKLIEETCMPLATMIADEIEAVTAMFLNDGKTIFADFDWTRHSTMQAVRREIFGSFKEAVGIGMPPRTAGEYFGLALPRFPGDEIGRIPFNLTEIIADGSTADPEPPADDAPEDKIADLFAMRAKHLCKAAKPVRKTTKAASDTWAKIHKAREPWERKFEQKISRYLMDARAETLRKIATFTTEEKTVAKSLDALSLIFDLNSWLTNWTRGLLGISRAAIEAAGFELWSDELGKDDPLTMPAAEVLQVLGERENRLKGAGEKVWTEVKDELEAGIKNGDTIDELAARVKTKFKGIESKRAKMIAITETTVVYESARDMVFRAAGVQWTMWVHSGLADHARLNHQGGDGQIRELGEQFDLGSAKLFYPGDPAAPASEVIGCKCVRIAATGPDQDEILGNDDDGDIPY